jgi:diguanylate cyclase (GGDEF)-like protein
VEKPAVRERRGVAWLRRDANWELPLGLIVVAAAFVACVLTSADVRDVTTLAATVVLMVQMATAFRRTSRLPDQPKATARFWASTARAIYCYGLGTAVDLGSRVSHLAFGTQINQYGSEIIYPIAGLLTIVAMYQYPTTARTRGERITVGLDAAIVLLGTAGFIWYFNVSRGWTPHDGWTALFTVLVLPVLTMVTGFATLKIAYIGASVISRPTVICFGISIVIAAGPALIPAKGGLLVVLSTVTNLLSPLSSLVGGHLQYKISKRGRRPQPRSGRRRTFSVLPFGASTAAFVLLVAVLSPELNWRQWGVLGAIGLLLCAVGIRQFVALRENGRLLASNHELTAQLRRQAWFDELTGLANRANYAQHIGGTIASSRRHGTPATLLLIDLDDFKSVNDTLGHAAGDELLQEVAGRLTRQVRPADLVCRLGGDEFVVIAEGLDTAAATALADRIVQAVVDPVHIGAHTVAVGASIGIAQIDGTVADPGEIFRTADVAMYKAKAAGKRTWQLAVAAPAAAPEPAVAGRR